MVLWRISNHSDLDGVGGERGNARWHTKAVGKRIVYLAEHPALALVETLVNLNDRTDLIPERFQLLCIAAESEMTFESVHEGALEENWREDLAQTQALGDEWLENRTSALLAVPSAPSPESTNYLFNPLHPDAAKISVRWSRWIRYDRRIFRVSE